jgi:hypothetical protein
MFSIFFVTEGIKFTIVLFVDGHKSLLIVIVVHVDGVRVYL